MIVGGAPQRSTSLRKPGDSVAPGDLAALGGTALAPVQFQLQQAHLAQDALGSSELAQSSAASFAESFLSWRTSVSLSGSEASSVRSSGDFGRSSITYIAAPPCVIPLEPLDLAARAPQKAAAASRYDQQLVLEHAVTDRDTLQGIALRYGVPVESIRRLNRLYASDSVHLRSVLLVPCAPAGAIDPASATPLKALRQLSSAATSG